MARPVNGIAFRNNGSDIIVGVKMGYARPWSGPQSNPYLDFEAYRNNLLFDFALSLNWTTVAASTHDSMIRILNAHTGAETAAHPAPDG